MRESRYGARDGDGLIRGTAVKDRVRERERESEGNSRRDVEREPMRLSREDEALCGREGKGEEESGEDPLSECQERSEGRGRSRLRYRATEKEAGESR